MMDEKKYRDQVVCCHNPEHVFSLVSDFPLRTDVAHKRATYCARCDAFVHVSIQTDPPPHRNVTPKSTIP